MARGSFDHPLGVPPPEEWWSEQKGHASAQQFQEWANSDGKQQKKKRSKFNANRGYREDLGHHCESSLEANTERLLRFLGYQPWVEKNSPPENGLWYRYEGEEFNLPTKRGKIVGYVPDFHVWTNGVRRLWEAKGALDQRSKQRLSLMAEQHPELPIELITYAKLKGRKAEALFAASRRGPMFLDINGWEGD